MNKSHTIEGKNVAVAKAVGDYGDRGGGRSFPIQRGTKEWITTPPRSMATTNSTPPNLLAEANSFSQPGTCKAVMR